MIDSRKIDLRKKYRHLYSPTRQVQEIVVPELLFVTVTGKGAPGSINFQNAIGAVYAVTYSLLFAQKHQGTSYTIGPLEGLWWTDDGTFEGDDQNDWHWKLMVMQPEFITDKEFGRAIDDARAKKPNPALNHVRLESFAEGPCIQIMHIGPYSAEASTITQLEQYAALHHLQLQGKHHEVYLGDPRRAKPERLKTILRHPVSGLSAPIRN